MNVLDALFKVFFIASEPKGLFVSYESSCAGIIERRDRVLGGYYKLNDLEKVREHIQSIEKRFVFGSLAEEKDIKITIINFKRMER